MSTLTAEKSEYEVIPTGEYLAQITDQEDVPEGTYGPQIKLTFEIVARIEEGTTKKTKYAGKTRFGWASKKLTKGEKGCSKLWSWVEAAYNRKIEIDEMVDTDSLQARRVIIVNVVEPAKNGEGEVCKITAVKPYPKQDPYPTPGKAQPKTEEQKEADGEFETGAVEEDDDPFEDQ